MALGPPRQTMDYPKSAAYSTDVQKSGGCTGRLGSSLQSTQHRRSALTGTADENAPLRNQLVKIDWNLL